MTAIGPADTAARVAAPNEVFPPSDAGIAYAREATAAFAGSGRVPAPCGRRRSAAPDGGRLTARRSAASREPVAARKCDDIATIAREKASCALPPQGRNARISALSAPPRRRAV
jgi:hypothetical protein